MNTIYLHGRLKDEFGSSFDMEVADIAEALRALTSQLEGFAAAIKEGTWRVLRDDQEMDEESLGMSAGSADIHFIPAVAGRGGGGGKAILGGALLIAATVMSGGILAAPTAMALGAVGAGIAVAGVTMMLTPTPEGPDPAKNNKDEQSFLFNGPVNVNKQGVPVPLVYGESMVGSVVISAGVHAEDIPIENEGPNAGAILDAVFKL